MKALLVFGARPNFMKIAPVYRAMVARDGFDPVLLHTGQHFDKEMSDDFIEVLDLPAPDIHLGIGSGTQAAQVGEIMKRLEPVVDGISPDVTVVVGDVSSTMAAGLVSSMAGVPVAHVEAGLRSRDWRMPEERNRVLTDQLSKYLLTTSADADDNLRAEGIDTSRIFCVGNTMIDSLDWVLPRLSRASLLDGLGLEDRGYGVVTLHRPSNVDEPSMLDAMMDALTSIASDIPLIFPVHPRTRAKLNGYTERAEPSGLRLLAPLGYSDFVSLLAGARIILTDSGGIQEEATVLGVPCLTLRENTERPVTLESGVNELVGTDPDVIVAAARRRLSTELPGSHRPPLWDGRAADRILDVLEGPAPAWPDPAGVRSDAAASA